MFVTSTSSTNLRMRLNAGFWCFGDIQLLPSGKPKPFTRIKLKLLESSHLILAEKRRTIWNFFKFEKVTIVFDYTYLYMFCCLLFSSRECLPHMEMLILPRKCCEFRPILEWALIVIDQWGFFNMPHLL